MSRCQHCGESGGESTNVEIKRLLKTSTLKVDLCRDCHAALVDFIEHGDLEEEEPEEAEGEDEDDD